jgi:hypothetical protein
MILRSTPDSAVAPISSRRKGGGFIWNDSLSLLGEGVESYVRCAALLDHYVNLGPSGCPEWARGSEGEYRGAVATVRVRRCALGSRIIMAIAHLNRRQLIVQTGCMLIARSVLASALGQTSEPLHSEGVRSNDRVEYGKDTLPMEIRSRRVDNNNGLTIHIFVATDVALLRRSHSTMICFPIRH